MDLFWGLLGLSPIRDERELKESLKRVTASISSPVVIEHEIDLIHVYCADANESQTRSLEFLRADGLNVIATVMAVHKDLESLQTQCLFLVGNILAWCGSWNHISETGITEMVASAMECYSNNLAIQEYGILVLTCVTFELDEIPLILKNGCTDIMIRAICNFPNEVNIQTYGMQFISNISFDLSTQHIICALGMPDVVHHCLKKYSHLDDVLAGVTSALANILYMNPTSQIRLLKCGVVDTILEILDNSTDQIILGYCSRSLSFLYSTDEALEKYYRPDVIEKIRVLEERYRTIGKLKHSRLSLERVVDPVVADCVKRGVCVNEGYPICSATCKSEEGMYCPTCCVQQKSYVCIQCDGEFSDNVYCESCWNKYHKDHNGKCYFFASRCRNNQ